MLVVVVKRRGPGRPPLYKTEEERKARIKAYNREWRKSRSQARIYAQPADRANRNDAEFDPRRDGLPQYRDLTAQICGDPPIGRSALDKRSH